MDGRLKFGDVAWTPGVDKFGKALALTRSGQEREELQRVEELAIHGRLVRREVHDGLAMYLVQKSIRVKGVDVESRRVTVVASTQDVDRYGDTIDPRGWITTFYRLNPVVLIDHDYSVRSIVGHSIREWVSDGSFMMEHQIDPPTNVEANMVMARLASGSLRATSVGFRPVKWAKRYDEENNWTGGFDYLSQELLEDSYVAVPANPSAVVSEGLLVSTSLRGGLGSTSVFLEEIARKTHLAALAARLNGD